ncbi:MAG TPA: HEAT repeat domain-containing protein [Polyangiaceae bacterium]|nr:HEAT repeat domain-containing protein [Polyangiaceae bacterium]
MKARKLAPFALIGCGLAAWSWSALHHGAAPAQPQGVGAVRAAPPARIPSHLGGETGSVWEYDAELSLRTSAKDALVSSTTVRGALRVSVFGNDLLRLRGQLREPKLTQVSGGSNQPTPPLEPIERQLAEPFEFSMTPRSEATSFRFATDVEAFSSRLLRSMVAFAQVVREPTNGASAWDATAREPSGEFLIHYAETAPGLIHWQKVRAEHWAIVTASLGLRVQQPTLVSSSADLHLEPNGMISALSFDEHDSIHEPALLGVPELDAVTHFSLSNARQVTLDVAATEAEKSLGPPRDMDDDSVNASHDYWADLSRIGGRRLADVSRELAQARADTDTKSGRAQRTRSFVAAAALLRRDRSAVSEVERTIRAGGPESSFFINALGAAGTLEATKTLTSLLQKERDPAATREILRALGNAEHPSSAALSAMTDHFADHQVGGFARLMTGAMAHSSARSEPAVASAASDALLNALEGEQNPLLIADTLRALGNSGDPRAVGVAAHYIHDPNPMLRSAAAQAVRRVPNSEADALLVELAADLESSVRDSAMNAALDRLPSVALSGTVEQLARRDLDPSVRRDAVRVLVGWQRDSESARDTLMWVAANEPNDKLRQVAAEGLQRYN